MLEAAPWIIDSDILWNHGYVNAPEMRVRTNTNPLEWPNKKWRFERQRNGGGLYIAESGDGRAQFHGHDEASLDTESGKWMTPRSDGYGGRCWTIPMEDGRDVTLRGPWFGAHLPGYTTLSFCEPGGRHPTLYYFGLWISVELWHAIFQHWHPLDTLEDSKWSPGRQSIVKLSKDELDARAMSAAP